MATAPFGLATAQPSGVQDVSARVPPTPWLRRLLRLSLVVRLGDRAHLLAQILHVRVLLLVRGDGLLVPAPYPGVQRPQEAMEGRLQVPHAVPALVLALLVAPYPRVP